MHPWAPPARSRPVAPGSPALGVLHVVEEVPSWWVSVLAGQVGVGRCSWGLVPWHLFSQRGGAVNGLLWAPTIFSLRRPGSSAHWLLFSFQSVVNVEGGMRVLPKGMCFPFPSTFTVQNRYGRLSVDFSCWKLAATLCLLHVCFGISSSLLCVLGLFFEVLLCYLLLCFVYFSLISLFDVVHLLFSVALVLDYFGVYPSKCSCVSLELFAPSIIGVVSQYLCHLLVRLCGSSAGHVGLRSLS
uniref:Uncharacterized protein n=1 Tax=Cannabis sativa TaxID=3483 RepID=A0A803PSA8_CANSA